MESKGETAMNASLTKRYEDRLAGVLSCYDRIFITGTLPGNAVEIGDCPLK